MDNISIVIGSWGSYNECNERSLGSKWLDLFDYEEWSEIEEELKKEGFQLDGIDEELFIQDVDNFPDCKEATDDFKLISSKLKQSENIPLSIIFKDSGIFISERLEQWENAQGSIFLSPSGKTTFLIVLSDAKAR